MLITFVRALFKTVPSLTIGVSEDQAEAVTDALAKGGWHLLHKVYAPSQSGARFSTGGASRSQRGIVSRLNSAHQPRS
jgi:hypothetical protein